MEKMNKQTHIYICIYIYKVFLIRFYKIYKNENYLNKKKVKID